MALRRILLVSLLVILAGCVSPLGGNPASPCPAAYPETPQSVTEETAKAFAESYEEMVAYNRVCDADSYGFGATTASKELSVELRTDAGFVVLAQQPYSASTGSADSDGLTRGVYYLTNDTSVRVSLYGADQRSPDTYAAADDAETLRTGQDIRVVNFANHSQPLALALTYTNTTPTPVVLNETYVLDAKSGLLLRDVATRKGIRTLRPGTGRRLRHPPLSPVAGVPTRRCHLRGPNRHHSRRADPPHGIASHRD